MCVGFWSLAHPDYALILCANRDEFLDRPTAPADWHAFEPVHEQAISKEAYRSKEALVLSGRDLLAGGTWLGINKSGRVCFLTNITEPPKRYPLSRGALLSTFLLGSGPLDDAIQTLESNHGMFAGFNMLALVLVPNSVPLRYDARFVTDGYGGGALHARNLRETELSASGLSNGIDGQGGEAYPKILNGTDRLRQILSSLPPDASDDTLAARLLEMLTLQIDPAPRDSEGRKSSISIAPIPGLPAYGTRVSTVILVRRDGSTLFVERDRWVCDTDSIRHSGNERKFRFTIPSEQLYG